MENVPKKVSMGRSVLRAYGGKLSCQYNCFKWDQPGWNRSTQRTWKKQRATQYKVAE